MGINKLTLFQQCPAFCLHSVKQHTKHHAICLWIISKDGTNPDDRCSFSELVHTLLSLCMQMNPVSLWIFIFISCLSYFFKSRKDTGPNVARDHHSISCGFYRNQTTLKISTASQVLHQLDAKMRSEELGFKLRYLPYGMEHAKWHLNLEA